MTIQVINALLIGILAGMLIENLKRYQADSRKLKEAKIRRNREEYLRGVYDFIRYY